MTDGVSLLLYKDEPVLHFLYEQSLLFDDVRCASQLKKLRKKKNRCQHARETLGVLFVRHTPRVLRGALTFLSFAKYF